MPFVNVSADPDQEYFCDGLAESLIDALSQIEDLRVVARTSAFSFKGKEANIRKIGRELNVGTILEGSVQKSGNRLRITAQLVNVADGYHLLSQRYDREMDDVFAIQDEITLAIVDKLKVELVGEEKARLSKLHTEDLEAHNLFLRGRYFMNKVTMEGNKKAIELFEQAIEKDPDYALAYAHLSGAYMGMAMLSYLRPHEACPKAKEAALKALEIDDTLAGAHTSLALIKMFYEWDWEGAEEEFKRAIELDLGYASVHQWYAYYLVFVAGRSEEALEEIEYALALDPMSPVTNIFAGMTLNDAGQYDAAIEAYQRAIEIDPNVPMAHFLMATNYFRTGKLVRGLLEIRKEEEISLGSEPIVEYYIGMVHTEINRAKAQEILDDLLRRSKQTYITPYGLACLYFALGEEDNGFEWLEKAYEERDTRLLELRRNADSFSAAVRLDPRFQKILERIGLADRRDPLIEAAWIGDIETVRDLIDKGADVNTRDVYGWTPLMYAAWFEHTDTLKLLLELRADVEAKGGQRGRTALLNAAANGRTGTAKLLVKLGADINAGESGGATPLTLAAWYGYPDTVKLLLAQGAEVEAKDRSGVTALGAAAFRGQTDIVKLLLAQGADIDEKEKTGRTALMGAAENGHTDTVKLLLEKGADVNMRSNWRMIMNRLVVLGPEEADVGLRDVLGWTALTYAEHEGHREVVKLLKEAGAKE
jgi:ankyrin repeat protein/TolB-like protein/Tfp pilus assembly protein PilF